MIITLIRHPQTTANEGRIIYGSTDYPYTIKGEAQLQWILDYIKDKYLEVEGQSYKRKSDNVEIYTSPRKRAYELADGISKKINISLVIEPKISEMNFGIFEGHTLEEVKVLYPKAYDDFCNSFESTKIPMGEDYKDFANRINEFVEELGTIRGGNGQISPLKEIIIVTHGAVIREILEKLLELPKGESWKMIIGNGSIIQLSPTMSGYRLYQLIPNGSFTNG